MKGMNPQNNTFDRQPGIRRLSIMGSTGSIGTQTLDIVERYPELFKVMALTACNNWQLLAEQARKHRPRMAVVANEEHYPALRDALRLSGIEVLAGREGLIAAATLPETDTVVGALVGYSGLESTVAALEDRKQVALANKETLVVGGELIDSILRRTGKRILPIDSEHSAIFQCLVGEDPANVSRLILTASGGPFRNFTSRQLEDATVSQALHHPNWEMGAKVTIDSATMMNKGFEMIEARWLFNIAPERIDVVVHPESVVHSMVEFIDGSVKAQMGIPDMRLPIEAALAYPGRIDLLRTTGSKPLDLTEIGSLTFEKPDTERFPLLKTAYQAAAEGGLVPALMNAANEVAVKDFLEGRIGFADISRIVAGIVDTCGDGVKEAAVTIESIAEAHSEGTEIARKMIKDLH